MEYVFRVNNIDPVSMNKIYQGIHWNQRKLYKDQWRAAFVGWHDVKFTKPVHIAYIFGLKKPMDSTNLAFMAKLIEDSLAHLEEYKGAEDKRVIENDDPKHVLSTYLITSYSPSNLVVGYVTDEESLPSYPYLLSLLKE